ncbi:MAG: hypothetical protein WC987_04820 [Mariniphaga sp.]
MRIIDIETIFLKIIFLFLSFEGLKGVISPLTKGRQALGVLEGAHFHIDILVLASVFTKKY